MKKFVFVLADGENTEEIPILAPNDKDAWDRAWRIRDERYGARGKLYLAYILRFDSSTGEWRND